MSKPQCARGHVRTKQNTYTRASGTKECRTCRNKNRRTYKKAEQDQANKMRIAKGIDRKHINATCEQLDAVLPGDGHLVTRLRKVMAELSLRKLSQRTTTQSP